MKKILSYVAAYLMWILAAALGVWLMLISRSAFLGAFALYAGDSVQRAWQVRFFDKVFSIAIGLLWLVAMIFVEQYFRTGVRRHSLLVRFARVAGPELLAVFVVDALLLWLQRGGASWLRWLALGGELVLGAALVWLARSAKASRSGKTVADRRS
jgi:hypothetical protein